MYKEELSDIASAVIDEIRQLSRLSVLRIILLPTLVVLVYGVADPYV